MHSAEPRTLRSKDRRQLSPRGDGAGGGVGSNNISKLEKTLGRENICSLAYH